MNTIFKIIFLTPNLLRSFKILYTLMCNKDFIKRQIVNFKIVDWKGNSNTILISADNLSLKGKSLNFFCL